MGVRKKDLEAIKGMRENFKNQTKHQDRDKIYYLYFERLFSIEELQQYFKNKYTYHELRDIVRNMYKEYYEKEKNDG